MEYEIEDRPPQMGEDDALDIASTERSPQRDRVRHSRSERRGLSNQDQALFIPEQEAGTG